MNFQEYTQNCYRTFQYQATENETISMLCMGLSGEAGEVIDYLKKIIYHKHDFDKQKLMSEMGDMMWYFALLADYFKIDFDEILTSNIAKLKKRYPNGFRIQDSINRAENKTANCLAIDCIGCPETDCELLKNR